MKSILLASVAIAAALCAAPAFAATGQVDLSYTGDQLKGSGVNDNVDNINFGGAAVVPLSGNWNAQFDGHFDRATADSDHITVSNGDAHLFYRNDSWALGGVVSVANIASEGLYSAGVDGQAYFGPITLGGNVSAGTLDHSGGGSFDFTTEQAKATYFVTPDLSLNVNGSNADGSHSLSANSLGVGGEWKTSMPLSIFAAYDHDNLKAFGSNFHNDAWTIGLRWNFGPGSLRDRENHGASLTTNAFSQAFFLFF